MTCLIVARLIAVNHGLLDARIVRIHAITDATGALVNVQVAAHAVTRSVIVVEADVPQCPSGKGVEKLALEETGKASRRQ